MVAGDSSLDLLKDVVRSLLSKNLMLDASYTSHVLTHLFVLAHHPMLPRYQWSWIDIARRSHADPGQLTGDQSTDFMDVIVQKLWPAERVFLFHGIY
jgi:Generalcontrol nonderepressible 1 (Gcn1) N-terminal